MANTPGPTSTMSLSYLRSFQKPSDPGLILCHHLGRSNQREIPIAWRDQPEPRGNPCQSLDDLLAQCKFDVTLKAGLGQIAEVFLPFRIRVPEYDDAQLT